MTNRFDKDLLSQQILMALSVPTSDMGTKALHSFVDLPGIQAWSPKNLFLAELDYIFNIGLPFALIGVNPTAELHRQQIGRAIGSQKRLPASLWSEVQAGALFSNWGAEITFIKRGSSRTPDIQAHWTNEAILDVEVTRADLRQLHAAANKGIQRLAGILQASDFKWNLLGFFANASDQNDLTSALDVVLTLRPGEIRNEQNRWAIRAIPLAQRDEVIGANVVKLFGPEWWPEDEPSFFTSATVIGSKASPLVQLRTLYPASSYINPVLRKVGSGQWQKDHAYLIAVDVSEMPRAHERIAKDLESYFPMWNHVSGVLLFESRFWSGIERKEWIVSIHRNPNAHIKLPTEIANLSDGMRHSLVFNLS